MTTIKDGKCTLVLNNEGNSKQQQEQHHDSMVGIDNDVDSSRIISSSSTYLIHEGSTEGCSNNISHSPRSSSTMIEKPQTSEENNSRIPNKLAQWLLDNYEMMEGVTVPRYSVYNNYLQYCQEQKLYPVNTASFGKLIHSVFIGLKTRRLGLRSNSKYHYSIRVKPDSPLNGLQDNTQYVAMRQQPIHSKQKSIPLQKEDNMLDSLCGTSQHCDSTPESGAAQNQYHEKYINKAHSLPPFPSTDLGSQPLPEYIKMLDVKKLETLYRDHCKATLDAVMNPEFHSIENLWQTFWCSTQLPSDEGTSISNSEDDPESLIPMEKLVALCNYKPITMWIRSCDQILYQVLVEILIPDVLRPIPDTHTQAIQNFAKSLEGWLTNAMYNFPREIVEAKVAVISAFAWTLRRYTSLNRLAQTAQSILQSTSQINQMLFDLNKVNFAKIKDSASWVCQYDKSLVQHLEQDFKVMLQQKSSLEQWATWLNNVVTQVLKPHQGRPSFPWAARQFLLKWSFYSSMVIRDITLLTATSLAPFHLIRLLFDEYVFYLVEHHIAQVTEETPIAVMGKFSDLCSTMPSFLEKNASITDKKRDLDNDPDGSGGPSEPAAKRQRIEDAM